jgi:hypothetical protein
MVVLAVSVAVTLVILIIERARAWWRENLWRREAHRADRALGRNAR